MGNWRDNCRQVMGQDIKRWLLPCPSPNDPDLAVLDSKDTGTPLSRTRTRTTAHAPPHTAHPIVVIRVRTLRQCEDLLSVRVE
jgi:hypothetical protein